MANLVTLDTKLKDLKSVGGKYLPKLEKLGIITVRDLFWHFPNRYEDFSRVVKISQLRTGERVTIRAEVKKINVRRSFRRHMTITEVIVNDGTAGIPLVWFNQHFIAKTFKEGMWVSFAGKVFTTPKGNLSISNPKFEILRENSETTHTAGLIAVYPETRGITSKGIRHLLDLFFPIVDLPRDFIPTLILKKHNLPELSNALRWVHKPRLAEQAEQAQKRFSFEYLYLLQLNNLLLRASLAKETAPKLEFSKTELSKLLKRLPFELTGAQKQTLDEILEDIAGAKPMNRLLQGDVGSGKTVVVALASIIAAENDYQSVFMAPTEVLARQHYQTFLKMFGHLECGVGLVTASETRVFHRRGKDEKKTKAQMRKLIESGEVSIIIGTHSLIAGGSKTKPLKFPKLALAVVDEQHRFGVKQRAALLKQGSKLLPHFLSMSATPIPRTLTLTVFGDLDLSTINELPKGRKKIVSKIVDPKNRGKAYSFIRQNVEAGRQVFFIFPRIEKTELTDEQKQDKRSAMWQNVKSVKEEFDKLSRIVFPNLKLAMLHGKLKAEEKARVMNEFKEGKIDILVSTSVVEVGVDVANATVMVIEGAERFGLSQLYQFRGRVGRGEHQSFCLLFTDSHTETTHKRLEALISAKNGFELAEIDLQMRGPGEFFGNKQTGIPDMAMDALSDMQLVKKAQDAAKATLKGDPGLKENKELANKLEKMNNKIHLE
ncbi:MAG: ATP-dependent DNA helicase RecG [Candidatus Harrisonbacteria bacterium CG10_big_fil_rev_8_21_14_0_10_44_23]|uniref:Probable DNA 3'-5' helicase RecG n=1 Tax=Candidatus Harrisonbacteria bacterium CG10_big_fil_rev_8_21_14_0_10_44_23 TaxID=1974585 RepID=A0A2H0UQ64_9BACT|nr:MAG: ATP-dependent DNA helicase RecG [Candidatus Harrisonbacteria bacterium CG10_big_fil_rev_8_21_14_0_10_44_23]